MDSNVLPRLPAVVPKQQLLMSRYLQQAHGPRASECD